MRTWLKIILALFVTGVIAALLVYIFLYNKPHPDFENTKPDFTFAASDLYNSYKTNISDSEKKYSGKVVELSGILGKVETTDSLVIAVFVFNQGMFGDEGIRCTMLKKYNTEAQALLPSSTVTIKGYCTGYNDPDVIIEQASIIK
jgi:hypothetical protein